MKKVYLLLMLLPSLLHAQSKSGSLQVGGIASFYIGAGKGYGGEMIANVNLGGKAPVSVGIGLAGLKFDGIPNIYMPAFLSLKIPVITQKTEVFVHFEPGYGIYNFQNPQQTIGGTVKIAGGVYFSGGVGIHGKQTSPYLNLQYNFYSFKTKEHITGLGFGSENINTISSISAVTFTAGIWINKKASKK